jgi:hypothetical protein
MVDPQTYSERRHQMINPKVFEALPLALKRRCMEYHLKKSGMTRKQIAEAFAYLKKHFEQEANK